MKKYGIALGVIAGICATGLFWIDRAGNTSILEGSIQSLSYATGRPTVASIATEGAVTPAPKLSNEQRYWLQAPNDSSSYGVDFEESGERAFLNATQNLLKKAIKSVDDRYRLLDILNERAHHDTIAQHYRNLPDSFYFVEEATRVKMLNFLISGLELTQGDDALTLESIKKILVVDVRAIGDEGLAKSVAGDQIRLLTALKKYAPDAYQTLTLELKQLDVNTKVLAYFEKQGLEN